MLARSARGRWLFLLPFTVVAGAGVAQEPRMVVGGGGVRLAVYEAGNPQGPPILFLHGFTGSHQVWAPQFGGPLAREFRLVAVDLRGHGNSDLPLDPAEYTDSRRWADDVAAVIRTLGLDRPVLVGWSYGGYIMADYLRAFGDSGLGGLVFVGAGTDMGTPGAMALVGEDMLGIFAGLLAADFRQRLAASRGLAELVSAEPVPPAMVVDLVGVMMLVPAAVRMAMFGRVLENDDVLGRVRVPTLVVHGARDRILPPASGERIARVVPGARLLVYDGVGHAPFLEAPERFDGDLAGFVRAARRGPMR